MQITFHPKAMKMLEEYHFKLFKHAGYLCCCVRMSGGGNINGYVGIPMSHSLAGKDWSDKIEVKCDPEFNGNYIGLLLQSVTSHQEGFYRVDCAFNVHGGITYARPELIYIDQEITGQLWWFGFDTAHSGDLRPYQTDTDRRYPIHSDEYRDMDYVIEQTRSLAEQFSAHEAR